MPSADAGGGAFTAVVFSVVFSVCSGADGADFTAVVFSVCSGFAVGDVAGVTGSAGVAWTVSPWRQHGAAPRK